MSEDTFTVPVMAADLQVGDVIKASDGHYYAVDTLPKPSLERQEYPEPHITIWVTEMNDDMTQVANSEQLVVHSEDVVLDVLIPRPRK